MIVEVPADIPVTIPVEPIVAIVVALLLHVPPPTSANGVVYPTQTTGIPVIARGNGFTVTTAVAMQPVPIV